MNKKDLFWQTYLNLENDFLDLSKYIFVSDENGNNQLNVYSPYICDFLLRVCVEIEAISKEIYFDNGGTKTRGDTTLMFDTHCLKLIDKIYGTHKKVVLVTCSTFNLSKEENKSFRPLREAHKQKGTDWERAYQAIKHDRYNSINKGTIKVLLHAIGALYLLNLYNKHIEIKTKYLEFSRLDFSFGSKLFSVAKPSEEYVINVINNEDISNPLISNESPFILKYTNESYLNIVSANQKSIEEKRKFFLTQPEMSDEEFLKVIEKAKEQEKLNPRNKMIFSWELCKYRLNKRIPSSFSFEERKRLLISSPEWNGRIRLNNKHLSENELTAENIQHEIDQAGILWGMELDQRFDNNRFEKAFSGGVCEVVLDNGKINY